MNQYIMLDLETTGLGPKATIIEIAMGLLGVNDQGVIEIVDSFDNVIRHPEELWWQPGAYEMHRESGLLSTLRATSKGNTPEAVAQGACYWLQIKRRSDSQFVMCGNSVHADRAWLKADETWRPLEKLFHHRMLDVSAFQSTAELLGEPTPEKKMGHRAMDDIVESTRLLNYWASYL